MSKKLTKKQVTELLVEAENIQATLTEYKALYARLDEITASLIGQELDGKWVIVDNFADRNCVFRPVGVRRFELKKVA